jgi:hypothetical protein
MNSTIQQQQQQQQLNKKCSKAIMDMRSILLGATSKIAFDSNSSQGVLETRRDYH